MKYNRIIVPIIKSEYCDTAMSCAFNLAATMLSKKITKRVTLVGMHVIDGRLIKREFAGVEEYKLKQVADETLAWFREKAQAFGLAEYVDTYVGNGVPAESICNYAKNTRADMIIMAERVEKTFLSNPLMGGTSEVVIRRAPCPVFISRFKCMMCDYYKCYQSHEPSAVTCKRTPGIRRILFPYDGSPQAKRATEHVAYWAETWGSDLTVIYVGRSRRILERLKPHFDGLDIPQVDYLLEKKGPKTKAAVKIVEVEKRINADLIIMGAFGDPKIKNILIGSTTSRTTRNASCPVLLVR